MSKPAFTPGPWLVKHTDTTYYLESADDIRIASTSWHLGLRKPHPSKKEALANMRAASAVPDMVEALTKLEAALRKDSRDKTVLSDTVEYHLDGQVMYQAINCARTALAKALGESSLSVAGE